MITAKELIAILQALPEEEQALPLWLEGCDCWGAASGKATVKSEGGWDSRGRPLTVLLVERAEESHEEAPDEFDDDAEGS